MKSWLTFVILITFWISCSGQHNQFKDVKFYFENNPIDASELLNELTEKLNINISYNSNYLHERAIDIGSDSISLASVLSKVFQRDSVPYKIIGNQLAIYDLDQIPVNCYQSNYGEIKDLLTQHPLEHVNITETQTGFKTVSNGDGRFLVEIPCGYDSLHLTISTPGYRELLLKIPVNEDLCKLNLEGTYVSLQEVIVRGIPAQDIMQMSYSKIKNNYLDKEANASAFFREIIYRNKKLVKLSEGAFKVHRRPYHAASNQDRFSIRKSRRIVNRSLLDTLEFKIKGSLKSCLELDIVKNRPSFYSGSTSLEHYEYHYEDMLTDGQKLHYVIGFKKKSNSSDLPYQGVMVIDSETLAITSITFDLDTKRLRNMMNPFLVKASKGYKAQLKSANYFVSYSLVEDRLALNYVSLETSYKVKRNKGPFSVQYKTQSELLTNSYNLEAVSEIRNSEAFQLDQVFLDEPQTLDQKYWEGLGAIPLEQKLLKASSKLLIQ